jgi:micrococcal nuclease
VAVDTTLIPRPAPLKDGPTGGPRPPEAGLVECRVVAVSDGDGLECQEQGRVRLIGIDAPELDQHPFGQASTAALAALAPPGTVIRLEPGADPRDRYRRLLAYAWLDGTMLNWLLVRRGWGVSLAITPNTRYRAQLEEAEQAASRERLGLWAVDGFRCRPADRRGRRC